MSEPPQRTSSDRQHSGAHRASSTGSDECQSARNGSSDATDPNSQHGGRSTSALLRDERAIEGLPVRLVIALVVGVASLSVMMGMISGIDGLETSELDAQPDPDVVDADSFHGTLVVTVVDDTGQPVSDATVVLQPDTAGLVDGTHNGESNEDGRVVFRGVQPELQPGQQQGTLSIDIHPPAGTNYQDERENSKVLVLEDA